MFANLDEDMVIFSAGIASELVVLSDSYRKAKDENSINLRNSFFAVMVHGLAGSVSPGSQNGESIDWHFDEFAQKLKYAWREKGKGRAILMLSCYTGYGMARPLARRLKMPIVAGRAAVTITSEGVIQCVKMADASRNPAGQNLQIGNKLDWVFVSPGGQIEISGKSVLDIPRAISFADKFKLSK